jgi:hypothetical protein
MGNIVERRLTYYFMKKASLYNGKQFPDYVFFDNSVSCRFVEFDFVFEEEFWAICKRLLAGSEIDRLSVENVQPKDYVFYEEINVEELPKSFFEAATVERSQSYISGSASFYMLTEIGLIYPSGNCNTFCLYLDRRYELAIIGFANSIDTEPLKDFFIKDIADYLTLGFKGREVPENFIERVYTNYK